MLHDAWPTATWNSNLRTMQCTALTNDDPIELRFHKAGDIPEVIIVILVVDGFRPWADVFVPQGYHRGDPIASPEVRIYVSKTLGILS
jgi:hypothetical protein